MKKLFTLMSMVYLAILMTTGTAYSAGIRASWEAKTVYNKVNLKAEYYAKNGFYKMYSTSYFGVPELFPINSKFEVDTIDEDLITLKQAGKADLRIYYNTKHSGDMGAWMEDHFSLKPVTLPKNLTKRELELIKTAEYEKGMSREALFLSIGYPPKSLTANLTGPGVTYEKKRFNKVDFSFNDENKVSRITD